MPGLNIGPGELILILVIALIVFGPGKLPEIGQAVGKGIREFRKAATDVTDATRLDAPPTATGSASTAPSTPAPAAPTTVPPAAVPPAAVPPAASAPDAARGDAAGDAANGDADQPSA